MIARVLGWPWAAAAATRVALYHNGILRRHALDRPVISVGALEMGGTGKTPATAAVAVALQSVGLKPAIVSRGYGRTGTAPLLVSRGNGPIQPPEAAGDEPWLLGHVLSTVPVAVAARREHAAALLRDCERDVYLLDDAFQHVRIERDLDLLVVDFTWPFWESAPPPLGWLREGVGAAQRADAVLTSAPPSERFPARWAGLPRVHLRTVEAGLRRMSDWLRDPDASATPLPAGRAVAFAGIARPGRFFAGLRDGSVDLALTRQFADHHRYTVAELETLSRESQEAGASWFVTTEKDAARLAGAGWNAPLPVYVWTHRQEVASGADILASVARGSS